MRVARSFVVLSVLLCGCTAYLKQQNVARKSARGEAAQIALGGVAQLLVGGLIVVGSYYWFKHADAHPEPLSEDELSPKTGAVLGMLLGGSLVLSGVADDTIALYQAMSNDYVLSPVPAYWPSATRPPAPTAPTSHAAP
jgi:hypothetical protein